MGCAAQIIRHLQHSQAAPASHRAMEAPAAAASDADRDTPRHLQQLASISAALLADKVNANSVTWVPDIIPQFIQRAVQAAAAAGAAGGAEEEDADAADDIAAPASAPPPPAPPPPTVAVGSQLFKHPAGSGGSSSSKADWLVTTCLVPEGMPTAAAAEGSGGLATLEVVCRVLILHDCEPCQAPPALVKALSKVKWQHYGLSFREFFTCSDDTGILTLAVLPEAVVVPLSLVVCCCTPIPIAQGLSLDADEDAGTQAPAAAGPPEMADTAAGAEGGASTTSSRSSKRRRGGGASSRPPAPPAALSLRRSVPLWVGAFQAVVAELKGMLPQGYFMARVETIVGASLGPIAASLANIMLRSANAELRQQSCTVLQCEAAGMEESLLSKLQVAAADALAGRGVPPVLPMQQQAQQQAQQQQQYQTQQQLQQLQQQQQYQTQQQDEMCEEGGHSLQDDLLGPAADEAGADYEQLLPHNPFGGPEGTAGRPVVTSGLGQQQQQQQQQQWARTGRTSLLLGTCSSQLEPTQQPPGDADGMAPNQHHTPQQAAWGAGAGWAAWGVAGWPDAAGAGAAAAARLSESRRRRVSGSQAADLF